MRKGNCKLKIANCKLQIGRSEAAEARSLNGVFSALPQFSIFNLHFAICNLFSIEGAAQ
jgi:hypothetical protein